MRGRHAVPAAARRCATGVERFQGLHVREDPVELGGDARQLLVVEAEPREVRDAIGMRSVDGHGQSFSSDA
jgi:hypothetical protein